MELMANVENDTSKLSITIDGSAFFGQMEKHYYRIGKDSGDVRGRIYGDTLKGDFHYRSYGGDVKRVPFMLLKEAGGYRLGTGLVTTYMNLPMYVPGTLSFTDSDVVFREILSDKNPDQIKSGE